MRWRRALAATALLVGHARPAPIRRRSKTSLRSGAALRSARCSPSRRLSWPIRSRHDDRRDERGVPVRALGSGGPGRRLAARPLEATFAPTDVPGCSLRSGTRSLLSSLFADPTVGNPLQGDTLLWARLQDDTLHVYSLAIDQAGGFALEHSTGRLTDDGMVARYELRSQNDRIAIVEGRPSNVRETEVMAQKHVLPRPARSSR